jgi:hypothetical protein
VGSNCHQFADGRAGPTIFFILIRGYDRRKDVKLELDRCPVYPLPCLFCVALGYIKAVCLVNMTADIPYRHPLDIHQMILLVLAQIRRLCLWEYQLAE